MQIDVPAWVTRFAKLTLLVVERLVVDTPVAPVIAPAPEIFIDWEVSIFVKPVPKEIPL